MFKWLLIDLNIYKNLLGYYIYKNFLGWLYPSRLTLFDTIHSEHRAPAIDQSQTGMHQRTE